MNSSRILWSIGQPNASSMLFAVGMLGVSLKQSQCNNDTNNKSSSSFDGLSPAPPIYIFRPNSSMEIAFDTRTRNPLYVLEHLVPKPGKALQQQSDNNNSSAMKVKRINFYEEKSLPEEFRSRVSHYHKSGYDRGHLAAASNYMHLSQEQVNDTFNMCNISPQNHSMNGTIWAQLERWTQKMAQDNEHADTYVVSGPLWMPTRQTGEKQFEVRYPALGTPPTLVSVPTHFFKVVVAIPRHPHERTICKFACFVIPNQDYVDNNASNKNKRRSLQDYLVPWSQLEAVLGFHLFPQLATNDWKEKANQLTYTIMITSGQRNHSLPLLTDGGNTSTSSGSKKWRWGGPKSMEVAHFCAKGGCQ